MWPAIWSSVALAGGLAVAGGGLYLEGKKAGRNEVRAQVASQTEIAHEAARAAAVISAEAIGRIEVKNVTIRQQLEREVLTREVFRDCRSGPAAVQLLNQTIGVSTNAEEAGASDRQIPANDVPGQNRAGVH